MPIQFAYITRRMLFGYANNNETTVEMLCRAWMKGGALFSNRKTHKKNSIHSRRRSVATRGRHTIIPYGVRSQCGQLALRAKSSETDYTCSVRRANGGPLKRNWSGRLADWFRMVLGIAKRDGKGCGTERHGERLTQRQQDCLFSSASNCNAAVWMYTMKTATSHSRAIEWDRCKYIRKRTQAQPLYDWSIVDCTKRGKTLLFGVCAVVCVRVSNFGCVCRVLCMIRYPPGLDCSETEGKRKTCYCSFSHRESFKEWTTNTARMIIHCIFFVEDLFIACVIVPRPLRVVVAC